MKVKRIAMQESGNKVNKITLTVSGNIDIDQVDKVTEFFIRGLCNDKKDRNKVTGQTISREKYLEKKKFKGGHTIRSTGTLGKGDFEITIKIIPGNGAFEVLEDFVDSFGLDMDEGAEKIFDEMRRDYSDYM